MPTDCAAEKGAARARRKAARRQPEFCWRELLLLRGIVWNLHDLWCEEVFKVYSLFFAARGELSGSKSSRLEGRLTVGDEEQEPFLFGE